MNDDNIFDDDDALDYIIYEEISTEGKDKNNKKPGCVTLVLFWALPALSCIYIVSKHVS